MPDKLTAGALAWTAHLEPLGLEPSLKYKNAFEANLKQNDSVTPKSQSSRTRVSASNKARKPPKAK